MSTDDFDISDLDTADTAEMPVMSKGKETGWKLIFAGPGHPKAIEQADRLATERLRRERAQEQARVNNKKWTPPEESVDAVRERNIGFVVERIVDWSPVKIGGEPYPFSPENARRLLSDPKKGALLAQAIEFLNDDAAFTTRSADA
jgi:hypothetical protein